MRIELRDRVSDVTKNLIIINVICWLAQSALPRIGYDLTWNMGLHYIGSDSFRIWQLVTYMFLHAPGLGHIFFNMFALWMFGNTLERLWGSWRFLLFYLITGIGAGLMQELVWSFSFAGYPPYLLEQLLTIGASGAVYGILLGFGMMFPNVPLFIMFIPIPIKAKWLVIGYGVMELFLGVTGSAVGVAHFAHLGGMLFGFILIKLWEKRARARQLNDGWQDFY